MGSLVVSNSPIDLIKSKTTAESELFLNRFMEQITKLYQYEIFKAMLDLVSTLCNKNRLVFKVFERQFFEFDEGNCKTIEGGGFNKILNQFKSQKNYIITIKKIAYSVIVHEIAHMMEKEGDFKSLDSFMEAVIRDMKNKNTKNITLITAVNQIFNEETKNYPQSQKASEFFARFFQIISMAKEVAGFSAEYGYTIQDCYDYFTNTITLLGGDFYKTITSKIDIDIAHKSQLYIKKIEDIKHKWSEDKSHSIHENPDKPKWSKAVKSMKDNIFNQ